MFADSVPDLFSLVGEVAECSSPRGTFAYSNGGYAMLGQLIADVSRSPYADAATRMVLGPLGMSSSWFPTRCPDGGAITGYRLSSDGTFEPAPARICTVPSAGGLWTTASDLVRFGLTWSSLLPDELAREALRPHAAPDADGARVGLGWLVNEAKDVCGHTGDGQGTAASLVIRLSSGRTSVACSNRQVPVEPVNARLVRPIA